MALSLLGSGCAAWPRGWTASDEMSFLSQALEADARARETLWKEFGSTRGGPSAELRVALLQSLPGHSGYDIATARQRLEGLAAPGDAPGGVSRIARLRLAEIDEGAACRADSAELRQRLARVVDIERRMNQGK